MAPLIRSSFFGPLRALPAVALLLALTTACGGVGRGFSVPAPGPEQRLRPEWQRLLHSNPLLTHRPREYATPVVDSKAGTVFVGSNDGVLYCLDAERGSVRWRRHVDGPIWTPPLLSGEAVYVGTGGGAVHAFGRKTGRPLWARPFRAKGAVNAPLAASGGRLFVSFDTNVVRALDAEVGDELWTYSREHLSAFTLDGHAAPLVHGDHVVTGFSDGALVAVRVEDGSVVWERSLASGSARFQDADGDPTVRDGVLYASSNAGGVYALDPATGEVRWRHEMMGASSPVVTDRYVYVTSLDDRDLRCLARDTGAVVWRSGFLRGTPSTPTVVGGYAFLTNTYTLVAVDAESGRMLERFSAVDGFSARPGAGGGQLFVLSNRGVVHAFGMY